MKKNRGALRAEEEDNEINLTPMLDVVFIMLIFFIVTASFIKEAGIDVIRPDATTATAARASNAAAASPRVGRASSPDRSA